MSNFNIEEEIDAAVDKVAEQLKARLKKMVERSEKLVIKQYITSQKETSRKDSKSSYNTKAPVVSGRSSENKPVAVKKSGYRKKEYVYSSDSEDSD